MNLIDWIIVAVLAVIFGLSIFRIIKNKKEGKCNCGCSGCSDSSCCSGKSDCCDNSKKE